MSKGQELREALALSVDDTQWVAAAIVSMLGITREPDCPCCDCYEEWRANRDEGWTALLDVAEGKP